jgi:hypothetical protein
VSIVHNYTQLLSTTLINMNYCKSYFGKSVNDLTISDIEGFFKNERIENDHLEFKSIHPSGSINEKYKGIIRTVCALLNSGGGLLIWGSPEGERLEGKKEKSFKGNLTYFDEVLEKDSVVSKISDSINPLPSNIRINILEKSNSSIVIIEIDESEYSPHQTSDTYFMRIDGQTKPAPHHYIEALFKKIKYPNLEAFLKITKAEIYQTGTPHSKYLIEFDLYFFNWSPLQNEEQLSFRVVAENGIYGRYGQPEFNHLYRLSGHEYFEENAREIFYFGEPVREAEVLLFDPYEVGQKQNRAVLFITFGGKLSPRKTSEYILDFTKIHSHDLNDMIIQKKENRLTKDVQDDKGVNKESIIQSIMQGPPKSS